MMQLAAPAVSVPGGPQLWVQTQHVAGAVTAFMLRCEWCVAKQQC